MKKRRKGTGVRRKRTIFYEPPKHKWLANIITIASPGGARKAAQKLLGMAKGAPRQKQVLIKRALVLARNRAVAMAKKRNISRAEKSELLKVASIYENAYKKIVLR